VVPLERTGNSRVLYDSVVSEGPLCMLLACARASDAARVFFFFNQVSVDPCATVWMHDSVAKAKLATGSRSRPPLPLNAPAVISEEAWVPRWLKHRANLGFISCGDVPFRVRDPCLYLGQSSRR